jgi:molecular chaperone DnaK
MHVGIDLGTTFCCVAYIEEGLPQIIPDRQGREITPSVIWLKGNSAYVGEEANKKKISITSPIFEFFKRDMGKPTEPSTGKSEYMAYEIDGVKYGAVGLSSILLRKLKRDSWQYFKKKKIIDESVKESDFSLDAVITVPAYFGDEERQATKCAGELAGFNVIGIINEPTSASLTYGVSVNENKRILVFDLGGGTLDVTILEIMNGDFHVIATDGNIQLGGKDWDDVIITYLKEQFKKKTGTEIPDDMFYDIQERAIQAKKDLSESDDTTVLLSANGFDIEIKLFRSAPKNENIVDLGVDAESENYFYFDERCSDLLSRCASRCIEALTKADFSWEGIDDIVLAGGSCRMPMIPELLEKLSNRKIKRHRNGFSYDTAIAIGAALHGQSKGRVIDVTPKSIGIKLTNNKHLEFIDHLIYKNKPLPQKAQKKYQTDPYAVLEVYEGESKDPFECIYRGKLELENTQQHAIILLEVDESGILKVMADYHPEGIKETKFSGNGSCPDYLKEKIQSLNINS